MPFSDFSDSALLGKLGAKLAIKPPLLIPLRQRHSQPQGGFVTGASLHCHVERESQRMTVHD